MTGEILAMRLNTIHNLSFYLRMMAEMRSALDEGRFGAWRRAQAVVQEAHAVPQEVIQQ